ncbi:MoaD/ThiS family protein [Actinokineospora iranica]|uniref:Molybdopterin synthase sulfur carrier subunit n=1 Tax=Actinokineospora iranica TaxID=1271860 RepID=A0A1G6TF28_9PSEU|nr:MoaD/ThiS family protein [Actinokineospora iranica]SDD27671.1 Molybdopterin converting factor, small subunit [Actinokineospora iranica]
MTGDASTAVSGATTTVTVRYFAGARAAAGVPEETLALPSGATVHDALATLSARHGDALSRVLRAASFLVDGVAVRDRAAALPDGTGLDVLPPFAGG